MTDDVVPPLFTDYTSAGADPWPLACDAAADGTEAGLVIHDLGADRLRAAIVFAPDRPLRQSVTMLPLCGVAFQTALGILGPPALVLRLGCDGAIVVNGGRCGAVSIAAAPTDPAAVPDWLVVGLTLDLADTGLDGGNTPATTTLHAEGCAAVAPADLLAGWLRQILLALDAWEHEGLAELHTAWTAMARDLNQPCTVAGQQGTLTGADADLNPVLQTDAGPRIVPLTDLLKEPA